MDIKNILQINRNELKYEMHPLDALCLQNELDALLLRDSYSAYGSYMVRSLYFDSLNDIDFREKYAGNETRKKIRIRIYDCNTSEGKFELKQKKGNYSHKKSVLISREEIQMAMENNFSFLLNHESEAALELYSLLTLGCYSPKTIIEYQRTAFLYPENNIRITLDAHAKSSETDLNLLKGELPWLPVIDEKVILEVKYDGTLIKIISDVLKKYTLTQVSVSKYAAGRPIYAKYIL